MNEILNELFNKCAYGNVDDAENYGQLSEQEVSKIMKRLKSNLKSSEVKKRKKFKPGITFMIAAAAAACIGTTAFAAEKLGAFDNLKNIQERTVTDDAGETYPINKLDKKDYEKIGENAKVLNETAAVKNDKISISADSVYCDGRTLIIGVTGSLKDGNSDNYGYIHLDNFTLEINGRICTYPNGMVNANGYMVIDEGEQNSFSGSITCMLNQKITESTDIKVHFKNIECSEKYFTDKTSIGGADMEISVTPDTEMNSSIEKTFTEDEYSFTIHEITPAMMIESYSPADSVIVMVYDEYGNRLARVLDEPIDTDGDNTADAEGIEAPDTDTITVKFCDKQESDENGMPVVLKEITIDLSELN